MQLTSASGWLKTLLIFATLVMWLCRSVSGAHTRFASQHICPATSARLVRRQQSTSNSRGSLQIHNSMANLTYPSPIVINPPQPATASVIFLHGLGDQGAGWSDVASQFQAALPHVRFIFPNAPRRAITLNWGMLMPGWYDIASLEGINNTEDAAGLRESQRYVESLVAGEVAAGIPANRVVVGGFSQGGAVALLMLRSKTKLAAIVGLSTYLPLSTEPEIVSEANKSTPVLMCHGDADQVVAYQYGRASHAKLSNAGVEVDFATYTGMGHSACPQELKAIAEFLVKQLPPV